MVCNLDRGYALWAKNSAKIATRKKAKGKDVIMLVLARTYKKGFSTLPLSWTDRPTAQATNQHLRLHTVASGTTKKHSFIWHSFS